MEPRSRPRGPGISLQIRDPAWRRVPRVEEWVRRAAAAWPEAPAATIVLGSDREVKRLNARFRGRNKPTNVLTFEPLPGMAGDVILAFGVVRREARASRKRLAHHLAHLVLHGLLHLAGFDHGGAGEAREMERFETRLLSRIGVPDPWRHL